MVLQNHVAHETFIEFNEPCSLGFFYWLCASHNLDYFSESCLEVLMFCKSQSRN